MKKPPTRIARLALITLTTLLAAGALPAMANCYDSGETGFRNCIEGSASDGEVTANDEAVCAMLSATVVNACLSQPNKYTVCTRTYGATYTYDPDTGEILDILINWGPTDYECSF